MPFVSEFSDVLEAAARDDPNAASQLLPLVYDELRKLAASKLSQEAPGQTLEATALVHEAYLRLVASQSPPRAAGGIFANRRHFFAAAAEAMRRILIENARRKRSAKRGGGRPREELDEVFIAAPQPGTDLLALDEVLTRLKELNPEIAELVGLRYFSGLTNQESAEILGISARTANSWWAYARAWLKTELSDSGP